VKRLLVRRLLLCVPTLLGLTLVTFLLSRLAPGGPLSGHDDPTGGPALTKSQSQQLERLLELDRPLPEQYLRWLGRFAQLDFGDSLAADRRPVRTKIVDAFQVSIGLQLAALLLMYGIGVPLGLLCAAKEGSRFDRVASAALFLVHSLPMLLTGTILIALFCTGAWASLPLLGLRTPGPAAGGAWAAFVDLVRHAILPVTCLALAGLAGVTRYARVGVIEALRQPWIAAARARGLPERRLLARHALKNGLVPTITLLGNILPWLVGGSVVVETLFSLPGLGRLATESILGRDYPTVMALSVLVGVATMAGFLVTDLAYAWVRRRGDEA
jgi:peptide/nickel transport system permease protein